MNVAGPSLALVFGIFVGYFAFRQVVESRLDKLRDKAYYALKDKSYIRAIGYYKDICSIDRKDHSALSTLLELYLINGDYLEFDERVMDLDRLSIEPAENLNSYYLKALNYILKGYINDANTAIKGAIEFVQDNPKTLEAFKWDFSDVQGSYAYEQATGDLRKTLDNLIRYLSRGLGENLQRFESGDYLLL